MMFRCLRITLKQISSDVKYFSVLLVLYTVIGLEYCCTNFFAIDFIVKEFLVTKLFYGLISAKSSIFLQFQADLCELKSANTWNSCHESLLPKRRTAGAQRQRRWCRFGDWILAESDLAHQFAWWTPRTERNLRGQPSGVARQYPAFWSPRWLLGCFWSHSHEGVHKQFIFYE